MNKRYANNKNCTPEASGLQGMVRLSGIRTAYIAAVLTLTACASQGLVNNRSFDAYQETKAADSTTVIIPSEATTDYSPVELDQQATLPNPASELASIDETPLLEHQHLVQAADAPEPVWQTVARLETAALIESPWADAHSVSEEFPAPEFVSEYDQEADINSEADEVQSAEEAFILPDIYTSTLINDAISTTQAMIADTVIEAPPAEPEILAEPQDLWHRIRQGFQLSDHDHPRIQPHIDWYARHQSYLDRVVERARPFLYEIVQEVERNNIPLEIALLPVVESAFQPFAYSSGRAAGIWQFIPGTGKHYGLKQNWWYDGRRDVPKATRAALTYLSELRERFDGDWLLALAAYNSGEGRVIRAQKKNRAKGRGVDFWSLDLPNETKDYVPKLLAISTIVEQTEKYSINLASIPDEPYLTHVDIGSQIDLALAAELADLPIETLYQLNPAFNRWATDPKGPHILSLPLENAEGFHEALAKVDNRIQWQRHRIREGETLGEIAVKYQTTVKLLQQINNIRDKWIRAGSNIIIPVSTKDLKHYLSEDQRRLAKQHAPRNGTKIQHTVQKGDTLWDLSRQYDVTVSKLASWNSMAPRDSLKPGQRLVIWSSNVNQVSTKFAIPPSKQTRQRLEYKVRKGDSLARIAKKFRVTVNNLRNWNSLPKGKYLQPGQRLTLFVDVTRQS